MVIDGTTMQVVVIGSEPERIEVLRHVCNLLGYTCQTKNRIEHDLSHLIIIDAVDGLPQGMETQSHNTTTPIVWIVREAEANDWMDEPYVLSYPFNVESAVSMIQHGLRANMQLRRRYSDVFLYSLIVANSANDVLDVTQEYLAQHFDCDRMGVLQLTDENELEPVFWHNRPDEATTETVLAAVLNRESLPGNWLSAVFASGDIIGVMVTHHRRPIARADRLMIYDIAILAARTWVNAINVQTAQENITGLQAFEMIGRSIVAQIELPLVLENIAESARTIANAAGSILWLVRGENLQMVARKGSPNPLRTVVPLGTHRITQVLNQTNVVVVDDFEDGGHLFASTSAHMSLLVPLHNQDEAVGVIQVINPRHRNKFTRIDEWRLRNLASWSMIALCNAEMIQEISVSLDRERMYRRRLVQMEKLTALGQLVATVAHEIGNPLQIAQVSIDLIEMRNRGALDQQTMDDIATLQSAIDQISHVIQRVREQYRVQERQPVHLQINDLVKQTVELYQHRVGNGRIEITCALAENLPLVSAFEHELRQVLMNLIQNAIEAIPESGEIRIISEFESNNRKIAVTVEDSGVGIAPQMLDSVFDVFFTTKSSGSGLGLAVSRDIINQHGGNICVDSQLGRGTRFTITLPAA